MANQKKTPYFKKIQTGDQNLTLIQNNIEEVLKAMSQQFLNTIETEENLANDLNTSVTSINEAINTINSQLPPPVSSVTGIGDMIKIGTFTSTVDEAQTFTFPSAFVLGSDSDIQVVVTRTAADASDAFPVTACTKTGFTVNRNNGVDGSQTFRYIAINGFYLT